MAEDKMQKDAPSSQPKRPATTIDVSAQEVSAASSGEPPPPRPDSNASKSSEPPRKQSVFTPVVAGAAGGAIVGAAAICGLWYFGYVLAGDVVNDDLKSRLSKLEAQTRSTSASNQNVIADLAARIAKIETDTSTGPPDASRMAAVEANVRGVKDAVTSLTNRHNELRTQLDAVQKSLADLRNSVTQQKAAADSADLDKVAGRIAPLESAVQNIQQTLSAREVNAADHAARYALVAASLRDSVLRGAPYATELAAFKGLGGNAAAVTPLEPFAADGVPSADKLCAELKPLLPKLAGEDEAAAKPAGFLERLQLHAERLVRIRPVGEVTGSDSKAILARLEAKVERSDVSGALSELSQLPADQRAPAASWIAKAKAREAALAAAREISTKSVGALAPKSN